MTRAAEPGLLLAAVAAVLVWSGIAPRERGTWVLEVLPIFIGVPILVVTRARFPLSPLLYRLLAVHAVVLMVGAKYTYAEVPLGEWVQQRLDLDRNHYDRFAHFVQGFVPAVLSRELLLRTSPLVRGRWLFTLVVATCLAFSAFYELTEWWAAALGGDDAASFLGTQGDPWDTQWDMFLALLGAITAQLVLGRAHDRSLTRVGAG